MANGEKRSPADQAQRPRTWAIRCPCCKATLQIDSASGVLVEAAPKQPDKKDFDALLADVDAQRDRAEQIFEQERGAIEQRQRLLDERFKDALDAVERNTEEDEPERPPHPLDF